MSLQVIWAWVQAGLFYKIWHQARKRGGGNESVVIPPEQIPRTDEEGRFQRVKRHRKEAYPFKHGAQPDPWARPQKWQGGCSHRFEQTWGGFKKVKTVAGNGKSGYTGDGGHPLSAAFGSKKSGKSDGPWAFCIDEENNIYIGDTQNHVVRYARPEEQYFADCCGRSRV